MQIKAPRGTTIAKPQFDLNGKLIAEKPVLDMRVYFTMATAKIDNPEYGKPRPNEIIKINKGMNDVDIDHKDPRVANQLRVLRKLGFKLDVKLAGDDELKARADEIKAQKKKDVEARLPENVAKRRAEKPKWDKMNKERREKAEREQAAAKNDQPAEKAGGKSDRSKGGR